MIIPETKINPIYTFIIVLSTFIVLRQSALADDWPTYQHDAKHTGYSNALIVPSALTLAWSAPTGYSTPLVLGNTVFATRNGQGGGTTSISAFALSNGTVNWTYSGDFTFPSQAAVGGGFVAFVATPRDTSVTSLYVLDSITGTLRYSVPVPEGFSSGMPTMVQNPVTGAVTAFIADATHVSAVSLGQDSGSVLWSQTVPSGNFGGSSLPTVAGNSIILAGWGNYYAFDQNTGAVNHFYPSGASGGSGTTTTYDAVRHQLYISTYYAGGVKLSAYQYTDNNHITLLWQRTGDGIGSAGDSSVAIGPNGNVYTVGMAAIWELDPTTGNTLRSITGSFANAETPILSDGVLWAISGPHILAYDLLTLQLLRSLNGGSQGNTYESPGAISDQHFLIDHGIVLNQPGFDVYSMPIPEPMTSALITATVLTSAGWRLKKTRSCKGAKQTLDSTG